MFLKLYDIVKYQDDRYVVTQVYDTEVVILDIVTLKQFKVLRRDITKVIGIDEIRTSGKIELPTIKLVSPTDIQSKRLISEKLAGISWYMKDELHNNTFRWVISVISTMEINNSISPATVTDFFDLIKDIPEGKKRTCTIRGMLKDCPMVIKVTLTNIDGVTGVYNAKRVFGDDGVFGNIAKTTNTGKSKSTDADGRKTRTSNQARRTTARS